MTTTHAFMGLALAVLTLPVSGRHAPTTSLLVVAFAGGLFPDVDLVTNHRKTLHFPVFFPALAVACFGAYDVFGSQSLFLLGVGAAAAGLHSASDVLGGGLGYEPWREDSGKAVYNHALGRWHRPRRLVRYSGAPEDFALAAAFAAPVLAHPSTGVGLVLSLGAVLAGSALYAATRRRFSAIARVLRSWLPAALLACIPSIRFEDG